MPDWSYRTLLQPLLLQLPGATARTLALGGIGTLAKLPGGRYVIDFMGHMRPDPVLTLVKGGLTFPSRVGLGHAIDPTGGAVQAMSRFGFACIEVGPLDLAGQTDTLATDFHRRQRTLLTSNLGVTTQTLRENLRTRAADTPPVLLRVPLHDWGHPNGSNFPHLRAILELVPLVDAVVLDVGQGGSPDWIPVIREALPDKPILWRHAADGPIAADIVEHLQQDRVSGFLIDEPLHHRAVDSLARSTLPIKRVQTVRRQIGPEILLLARGGVIDPQDALDLSDAGADIVLIDDGLVFSGPGLSKRINEACLARIPVASSPEAHRRLAAESWFWTLLEGIALLGGGLLALAIAFTRVILPYDESFVGMNREQLCGVNTRLVDFMCHDRVSLAGTMVSLGLCYCMLSFCGSRPGRHWAQVTILTSSFVGFFTFFAFLGYGYFDPFHAFVAAILFQFQLFGLALPLSPTQDRVIPTLREDRPWRMAQWGQLLLITHAVALCTAGVVINSIGMCGVFVQEDLDFMQTTAETLTAANPRIIPLIAHDRASFGGMLLSTGVATLLPALWGFERGRPWLWWMLATAGIAGYLPAIGVHFAVGYTSSWHLAPALGGALVLSSGLWFSRPFLCESTKTAVSK